MDKYDVYHVRVCVKVISHVTVYRRLMLEIKYQYERVISELEHAHEEEIYLSGKMMAVMSAPATLSNYQYRTHDLQYKYISPVIHCHSDRELIYW